MYKIIVHDRIFHITRPVYATTFEEAARKYFDATATPHHTDEFFNKHWEIEVMGVKFHKTESATGVVSIVRPAPPSPVVGEIKLILPAWLRN